MKFSLCLLKHHTIKMYGALERELHTFLTSVMDGGKWSVLTTNERANSIHRIGTWVGPRACLNLEEKSKYPCVPSGTQTFVTKPSHYTNSTTNSDT
jgi:hypothetical protein